jgi:aminoglycoside 6'-N-acetyltransferase I
MPTAPVALVKFPSDTVVRVAQSADCAVLTHLRYALWPDASADVHAREIDAILRNEASSLPQVILVAEAADHTIAGFAEVGLRSHADGCDPLNPVGFLEGLYVVPDRRGMGIGRSLLAAAEDWPAAKVAKKWPPTPGLITKAPKGYTKPLGTKLSTDAFTIGRPYRL